MSASVTSLHHDTHADDKSLFGFWVYLMTDCVVFASLFATFAVLRNNTNGGPGGDELFNLNFVLLETIILLTSSFLCGLCLLSAKQGKKSQTLALLGLTALLGLLFLGLELHEFQKLYEEGNSWQKSGFLSAFFTLVGTHGLHITAGVMWAVVLLKHILSNGLYSANIRRLSMFGLFWHFLDVVWIFIFSIVYLLGAVS